MSTQSARMTIINDTRSAPEVNKPDDTDDTFADMSSEEEVALPRGSTRHKRHTPGCNLCDHQNMGECSRIERQKEQPATSGISVSTV